MEKRFEDFFTDNNYLKIKNNLFNYVNRKNEISKSFFKYYSGEADLLDVGSGISPVSPMKEKTTFIDLSKEGIEFLKKKNYNAKVGSITNIPEIGGKYGWVFCSEVLEHVQDYEKALKEIKRVLKKNGKAIITVPVYKKYWHEDDEFVEHYRRFEPDEFRRKLNHEGFKIIQEKPIGSVVERYLTLGVVKIFKRSKGSLTKNKVWLILIMNKILYFFVKVSLLFNSKRNTSIMLYICKKN